jgi:CRP-like cAMP-binding protein
MTLTDVSSALGTVPFFSGFGKRQLRTVAKSGSEYSYGSGYRIVEEGTKGVGFYMVLDGKVEVRKGKRVLASLSKGDFFGEMSLIDEQPRSADIVTVQPTHCFALSTEAFNTLIKRNPKLALLILRELTKRLRAAESSPVS